jgi:branched-chain amino acid transport system substrate-binding protein
MLAHVRPIVLFLLSASLSAWASGCSLGTIAHDDCSGDAQCVSLFGAGSRCEQGFCSDPASCTTGHDCRKKVGGGACVAGVCRATFPIDPACKQLVEPEDLLSGPASGPDAPLVIGAIFSLAGNTDRALTASIRLAAREINRTGGLNGGQKIGVVVCDNGSPKNDAGGDPRILDDHALDYLAGTLGAPAVIGPLSSTHSIQLVNRLKDKGYPTVLISPSATSPDLTQIDDRLHATDPYGLFWRTCPSDLLQGKALADDVIPKAMGKVAVIYVRDAYGEGLATVFRETYGVDQTAAFPFDPSDIADANKLAALADAVDAAQPGAVLLIVLHDEDTIKLLTPMVGKSIATKPFFFTDGSKNAAVLLADTVPAGVKLIIQGAQGTTPASPSGSNFELFKTNLNADFNLDASSVSYLAHAYDATYVGAYGIVYGSHKTHAYDGLDIAEGLAHLSAGAVVNVAPTDWLTAKSELTSKGQINIEGTSGHLDFDATTGEAPAMIEVWGVSGDGKSLVTLRTVDPGL